MKEEKINKIERDDGTLEENDSSSLRSIRSGESITDGEGITDGNGITNGNGIENRNLLLLKVERTHKLQNKPLMAGAIVVVLLLILTSIMVINDGRTKEDIVIDGDFKDWNDNFKYQDSSMDQLKNKNINILEYSVKTNGHFLFLYLKVEENMLAGNITSMDMVQIFIDSDKNKETGYIFDDIEIGADYMIEVSGRYNNIESSIYYEFDNDRANNDWDAWEPMFTVESTSFESELEIKVRLDDLKINKDDKILVYFHTFDANDNHDYSDLLISNEKGALGVDVINTLDNILEKGKTVNAMNLEMTAIASDITIKSITLERLGTSIDSDIKSINIRANRNKESGIFQDGLITFTSIIDIPSSKNYTVNIDIGIEISKTAISTHTIGFKIKSINLLSGAVTIKQTPSEFSYIEKVTDEIVIDGAFGDWKDQNSNIDNKDDVSNPNVDIVEYNSITESETASFYLKVDGKMMAGVRVPAGTRAITNPNIKPIVSDETKSIITVGNQETQPLPVVSGEDTACIFIDSDRNEETGYTVFNKIIGADYMIKIKGRYGLTSSKYYKYNDINKEWEIVMDVKPKVICDATQLEAQINIKYLHAVSNSNVYFHIVDWEQKDDWSDNHIEKKLEVPVIVNGNRGIPTWPTTWNQIVDDPDDTDTDSMDIDKVYWAYDSTHIFFRVTTFGTFDPEFGIIGLLLMDYSISTSQYQLAISTYYDDTDTTDKAKGYYWDTTPTPPDPNNLDYWTEEMAASANHIEINGDMDTGLYGAQLAFDRDEMDDHYSFDPVFGGTGGEIHVITSNYIQPPHTVNKFEDNSWKPGEGFPSAFTDWYYYNNPTNYLDDVSSYEFPESPDVPPDVPETCGNVSEGDINIVTSQAIGVKEITFGSWPETDDSAVAAVGEDGLSYTIGLQLNNGDRYGGTDQWIKICLLSYAKTDMVVMLTTEFGVTNPDPGDVPCDDIHIWYEAVDGQDDVIGQVDPWTYLIKIPATDETAIGTSSFYMWVDVGNKVPPGFYQFETFIEPTNWGEIKTVNMG